MESNMAPGTENDTRSGIFDDAIFCPECEKVGTDCHYCDGERIVSQREYDAIKELEKEENLANE